MLVSGAQQRTKPAYTCVHFCRCENGGSERLNNLLKVQSVNGRAQNCTDACVSPAPSSDHKTLFLYLQTPEIFRLLYIIGKASLIAQMVKQSICLQWRRPRFNPWVGKIPWRREWLPSPVFLHKEPHGQRSLVGYSSWGRKESDVTEQLTHTHTHSWNL